MAINGNAFLDTSVLLNFGEIGRFGWLLQILQNRARVTAEVCEEITHGRTKSVLQAAIESNQLTVYFLESLDELQTKAYLMGRPHYLGEGEASTIVAARYTGCRAIIDERVATAVAKQQLGFDWVLDTNGILLLGLERGLWTVEQAINSNQLMGAAGRKVPPLG